MACRPEWVLGLQWLHAPGCNPFFFRNKSFLVMKHLVDIFQLTKAIRKADILTMRTGDYGQPLKSVPSHVQAHLRYCGFSCRPSQ